MCAATFPRRCEPAAAASASAIAQRCDESRICFCGASLAHAFGASCEKHRARLAPEKAGGLIPKNPKGAAAGMDLERSGLRRIYVGDSASAAPPPSMVAIRNGMRARSEAAKHRKNRRHQHQRRRVRPAAAITARPSERFVRLARPITRHEASTIALAVISTGRSARGALAHFGIRPLQSVAREVVTTR